MHQHFRSALPARGEHLDRQKKDGQNPHHGITASLPVADLPASAATRHRTTGPEEDAEQNYKKTVVFQLVVGKRAGTVRSLAPRCWEVPADSPRLLRFNKGAVVRAAQYQRYTGLQHRVLNDFLFTTGFYYLLKTE